MKRISVFLLATFCVFSTKADEGMWLLPYIEKLNIQKMNGLGCVLTAEEIYSDQNISLKDAVVIFGGGCTGVMVSSQGLVFTNHHCGYDAIQGLSSVEHNYLKNGYTAAELKDEIPAPDLKVTFLNRLEDVTEKIVSQIPENLTGAQREHFVDSICDNLAKTANDTLQKLTAQVKPYFAGNQFYLIVYQTFNDIRFACAPPASVGKFGGDTDNWMYPRHTGDFSVFRVYADKNGLPAAYSEDNMPYSPKRFAKISTKGYREGSFAMILGNPGSTDRYLSSWGVLERMNSGNQARIDIRGTKQEVWKSFMKIDEVINLAYASKYARSSNYWKNSIGMNKAIRKLHIVEAKQQEEKTFAAWVNAAPDRQKKYGDVLKNLENGYTNLYPYSKTLYYFNESLVQGVEMPLFAATFSAMKKHNVSAEAIAAEMTELYTDYYPEVDKATFVAMLRAYKQYVAHDALPDIYTTIDKKFKGDFEKYANFVFEKSAFTTQEKALAAAQNKKFKVEKDPAFIYFTSIRTAFVELRDKFYRPLLEQIEDAERLYQAAMLEISAETDKPLYPDANFTMRLTYGTVGGYEPADAANYRYYTTPKGILEKEIPDDMEFDVPAKLHKAIETKDYAKYIDPETGELHVCFLSNNDITGGNSGSPVFNGKGELIGLAFDGNWEAMSGDIVFEPKLQRTISVDIRYVLFIMDKVGNAERLLKELELELE